MDDRRPDRATLAAFAGVVLMGGSNIVAVRFSNRDLAPFWGAALRFAAASAVMFGIVWARRLPLPRGRSLRLAMLYGVLSFTASYAFFYWGAVQVPAGLGGVIMAFVPLLTFFFAMAHGLERFRWRGLFGAALGVAGIAVIFAERSGGAIPPLRILSILAAAACAAESGILVKRIPDSHPVTTNAVAMATGTTFLFALSFLTREAVALPSHAVTWTALLYLALLGSPVLFILFVLVLQRWTASAASYQFVLIPIVAIVMAAWLAGEELTPSLLLGAPLVLAGVYVGALAPERTGRALVEVEVDVEPA